MTETLENTEVENIEEDEAAQPNVFVVPELPEEFSSDGGAIGIFSTIRTAIETINDYNVVALAEEKGTKATEIDKLIKADSAKESPDSPPEVLKKFAAYLKKVAEANALKVEYRNLYRVEVLNEDTTSSATDDFDVDALKEVFKNAKQMVDFLANIYAKANDNAALAEWAATIEIPNVGKTGTSTVGDTIRRPRVWVTVNGVKYDNFTKAAPAVAELTKDKVVTNDLTNAWVEAGEKDGDFTFKDVVVNVQAKPKKDDSAS